MYVFSDILLLSSMLASGRNWTNKQKTSTLFYKGINELLSSMYLEVKFLISLNQHSPPKFVGIFSIGSSITCYSISFTMWEIPTQYVFLSAYVVHIILETTKLMWWTTTCICVNIGIDGDLGLLWTTLSF